MSAVGPGFFGKVRSHGDFVSRRLPPPVASRWDDWLQACIHASRQELDAFWLSAYLTSPIWRFALSCGVVDGDVWAGVLMPSVDRVGRYFPLMLGAALGSQLGALDVLDHGQRWHDELETLALSALDEDFQLARFDAPLLTRFDAPALAQAGGSPACTVGDAGSVPARQGQWRFPVAGLDGLNSALLGSAVGRSALAGHSLWWTDGSPLVAPSLLLCPGLPQPSSFAAMLDGCWLHHGWQMPAP
jgi:type VI secretion system protein ImpM